VTGRGYSVASLLVRCAVMGALGAAVGAMFFLQGKEPMLILGVTLAAAVFGALVAVLTVAPEPPPPVRHIAPRPPAQSAAATPAANPAPARPRPTDPVGPTEPARLVLPVEAAPQEGGWWSGGPTARTVAPTRAAPSRRPAPDLGSYRRPVRTVQCPRCGAFRIDVQQTDSDRGGGYAFRCRVDDHTWTWRAGTGWPVTVVASRRRPDR